MMMSIIIYFYVCTFMNRINSKIKLETSPEVCKLIAKTKSRAIVTSFAPYNLPQKQCRANAHMEKLEQTIY